MLLVRFAAAALAAVTGLGIPLSPPVDTASSEWNQYRSAATNNANVTSGAATIHTGAIATANEVRATPVIADGTMFVGSHGSGELQAFDLATGELSWQRKAPNWVHSEMIYRDGQIFVGFGNRYDTDAMVGENRVRGTGESGILSFDAGTGEQLWCHDTQGEVMPTPALVNGSLYVVTGDAHLYELDPETGGQRDVKPLQNRVSMSSPAVADDVLYFGGGNSRPSRVYAYDTKAKTFAWRTELPEVTAGIDDVPPAVADGVVVTTAVRARTNEQTGERGETHEILALDTATGRIRWRDDLGTGPAGSNNRSGAPMIHDGTVFVGSPTTGRSYAYDLNSGRQLWHSPTGAVKGAPATDGDSVYFSTVEGTVEVLDPGTGERQRDIELDGKLAPAGPVIVDGTELAVPSQSAHVYIVPTGRDGAPASDEGTESSSFWMAGGALLVVTGAAALVRMRRGKARKG